MTNQTITYRGASTQKAELDNQRVSQLEQQQGTQKVQYRGNAADLNLNEKPQPHKAHISYRGAELDTEI